MTWRAFLITLVSMRDIFLIDFRGMQYGVWRDEILSVKDMDALHRIPFSPARIAGIMMLDGQAVALADLSVCIGFEPASLAGQGSILLMGEGKKLTGFVASGEIHTQSIAPQLIFPIPDYLKTPLFDSCAVNDNIPIPIINISELDFSALKGEAGFSGNAPATYTAQPQDVSAIAEIRLFSLGAEIYAASAAGIANQAVRPGLIAPLPNTPGYVYGITFRDGSLLPVIDLPQRITWERAMPQATMLIAELAGNTFGLLVDSDGVTLPANKVEIKPLPMIVRTAWLKDAVLRDGEIIPLVDLAMALSPGALDETPNWNRYASASGFAEQFLKQDVDVVEFSLLGERHALPKEEVEEVIAYKPCRALPDVPPIVIGVAEHKGEILPVLDIAMMFGRRSITTPAWRMMVLNNGNFRALVITETVYAERKLKPDTHREVPIHLPHHLLYGCYPDDNAVRIILNVEAVAVHFEKSLIHKFLPALSHQMKMMSTEAVVVPAAVLADALPVATPETTVAQSAEPALAQAAAAKTEKTIVPEIKVSSSMTAAAPSPKMPKAKHFAKKVIDARVEWKNGDVVAPAIAPGSAIVPVAAVSAADVTGDQTAEKKISTAPAQEAAPRENATAETIIAPETIAASAKPRTDRYAAGNKAVEPVTSEPQPDEVAEFPMQPVAAPAYSSPPARPAAATAPYRNSQQAEQMRGHAAQSSGARRRPVIYGGIVLALLAPLIFYVSAISDKSGGDKSGDNKSGGEKQGTARSANAPAKAALPQHAENPPAQLELNIPKSRPTVDVEVYVVVQGDTLWGISERFTGNPFNYPRIAGENKVADPDLIFPGQRIRLIK